MTSPSGDDEGIRRRSACLRALRRRIAGGLIARHYRRFAVLNQAAACAGVVVMLRVRCMTKAGVLRRMS